MCVVYMYMYVEYFYQYHYSGCLLVELGSGRRYVQDGSQAVTAPPQPSKQCYQTGS